MTEAERLQDLEAFYAAIYTAGRARNAGADDQGIRAAVMLCLEGFQPLRGSDHAAP
jgi:hypothetical protein